MKKPEVAVCLSGGGYRAATYHLGTLSYLTHLKMEDGSSLLESVNVMSTISGGSITGLWYMMNLCKGIDTVESFKKLYGILLNSDIPRLAIEKYLDNQDTGISLIKTMAEIFDEVFFHHEHFSLFLDHIDHVHFDYFTSNGADLYGALPFRFQAVKESKINPPNIFRGLIGNYNHVIPKEIARQTLLSEILASSSCFPGIFEPLLFPNDFQLYEKSSNREILKEFETVSVMDGGIVDNQGLDYLDIVQMQMASDAINDADVEKIDLAIVSDVAHQRIKHKEGKLINKRWFTAQNLRFILNTFHFLTFIVIVGTIISLICHCSFLSGVLAGLSLVLLLVSIGLEKLVGLLKKCMIKLHLTHYEKFFMRIKLYNVINLLIKRFHPTKQLVSGVFLRRIRRMSYHDIFSDEEWRFRRMTSQIYMLQSSGEWMNKMRMDKLPEWMKPSEVVQRNSDIANEVKTTLWFSQEEKEKNIPAAVVACGEFTTCWNILRFIIKLKDSDKVPNEVQQSILFCEKQIKEDWGNFQNDPFWLFHNQFGNNS